MDSQIQPRDGDAVKPRLFDAFFAALELLALVFWILSEKLHAHWIVHAILLSLAGTLFCLGAAHVFSKALSRPIAVWAIAALLSAAYSVLIFGTSRPAPIAQPQLFLLLETPQAPDIRLPLTNKALFVNTDAEVIGISNMLFFPVPSSNTPATFRLTVVNPSKETIDGFSVWIMYSDRLECSRGSVWEDGAPGGIPGTHSIAYRDDNLRMYPKSSKVLTDIAFKRPNGWINSDGTQGEEFGIGLSVETKGMERSMVAFKFVCLVLPSVSPLEPKIVLPNSGAKWRTRWPDSP